MALWHFTVLLPDRFYGRIIGAREEAERHGPCEGMLTALTVTGAVITAAGIVLAATFATLAVLPLVVLAQLGTVVALGVLIDTLLVRSVLVPALAYDLDDRFWWPARLHSPARVE
jgi:putative drug exporter of the RND superfamily